MRLSVDEVPLHGGASSSLVRTLVASGELDDAQALLGRPFEVEGLVTGGARESGTASGGVALRVDAAMALPPAGHYGALLAGEFEARLVVGERRVDLIAARAAAPLPGVRVSVGLVGRRPAAAAPTRSALALCRPVDESAAVAAAA
jgi:hypothetical protein